MSGALTPSAAFRGIRDDGRMHLAVHLEYPLYGLYAWDEGDEKITVQVLRRGAEIPEPMVGEFGAYTPRLFLVVPEKVRALPLEQAQRWVRQTMEVDAQARYGIERWMTERI